ncbi:MAG: branched-chain amino acid ABC transporter permease [Burkholderiales bacterium]|nr:MAG: branched-chain amino acid ABC transporter permease [Betaproteobacteria bacterium]TAG24782.1 MAG: branched-chain amino acid ABC transporter permease [Burkholderiales bacterium]TAG47893.1 MAG: branched-chain amino acid ABC transporter permease [Betaproteobacteria bacterium]
MTDAIQLLISGVATGAIYAMAALGFTLLWQAAGTINFAQGEFVMLPAFAMLIAIGLGAPLWLAFFIALIASIAILGLGFKKVVVDPMRTHGVIALVVATLGLSIGLKSLVKAAYSAEPHPFPYLFGEEIVRIAGVTVSYSDIGALVVAALMVIGLQLFLNRTITGRAMQAVAQNTFAAEALGINVARMIAYTFVINAILVTVTALLITPAYLAKFDMGDNIGLKAFFAAIIGGFNNPRGALLGGVLVGVLENFAGAYVSPSYKDGVALVLFLTVILIKPDGLLGTPQERKV